MANMIAAIHVYIYIWFIEYGSLNRLDYNKI
jgi:hypothetical protein